MTALQTPKRRRRTLPIVLTLCTVLAIALTGSLASTALLSDEVSLVAVEAHGGTLALSVSEAGFGETLLGTSNLENIAPGDSVSNEFTVTDTGSIDANLTFAVDAASGADPAGCFDYTVTDAGGNVIVAAGSLARAVAVPLGTVSPGTAGARTFTLTVTNREDCATNGATGSLAARITARQLEDAS